MSEKAAAAEQGEGQPAATTAAGPRPALLFGVLAAAALAGAGAGFVAAPRFLPAAHAGADAEEHAEEGSGGHGEGKGAGKIFRIDNLIVNPAGSEGTRFLMTSIAFEVDNPAHEARLRERDVQVRDLVVSRLETQTMAMLTQPFARDTLKRRLAEAVAEVLGPKARVRVYLPQFVIQ